MIPGRLPSQLSVVSLPHVWTTTPRRSQTTIEEPDRQAGLKRFAFPEGAYVEGMPPTSSSPWMVPLPSTGSPEIESDETGLLY